MKITVVDIMKKKPCPEYTEKIIKTLIGEGKPLLELASLDIPSKDRVWIITQFLDDKTNRKFAIWCARQYEPAYKEVIDYINIIERYYDGKATEQELNAASDLAYKSAYSTAYKSAYSVTDKSAAWAAYMAAYLAAYAYTYMAATDSAACKAAWRKTQDKQIKKLQELIGEERRHDKTNNN